MKKLVILLVVMLLGTASFAMMRIGVENVGPNATGGAVVTAPYIGWQLSDFQSIDVLLAYLSTNNGNTTGLNLGGKYTQKITEVKKVKMNWFGLLGITSATAAGNTTTTITLVGGLGAEYKLTDNIGIYGDIDILTLQSMSGAATGTNIFLNTADFNCFSGIRVYL